MTIRRTRHKLEPQCDQPCKQGAVQQTKTTLPTKKRHYKQTSAAVVQSTARVFSWCPRGFLHASGLRPHLTCCCACRSAFVSSIHLLSMFPHINFSPVRKILADFVDSHTAKTGLLRCCLHNSIKSP